MDFQFAIISSTSPAKHAHGRRKLYAWTSVTSASDEDGVGRLRGVLVLQGRQIPCYQAVFTSRDGPVDLYNI